VEVAALMNRHFVCVKVDREERSDVDMLYMQAVQLMSGHGGWPLNCFVLPDGRPFYGGTYFRREQWLNVLHNLSELYRKDFKKVEDYAQQLTAGIRQAEQITTSGKSAGKIGHELLDECVGKWKKRLDHKHGGPDKAPKFPLPNNYLFLLRYAVLKNDEPLLAHVNLTLTKMAFGGIYDQLNGGFARYSTDITWKVPHFEKMLYDNAQLVSLYCEAYALTRNELYMEVAVETLGFIEREWFNNDGFFYSAFDADSDGEEGRYYVWKKADLEDLLGEDYNIFSRIYKINDEGYGEHDNYILMREENVAQVLADFNLSNNRLGEIIKDCKNKLRQEAKSRIKPGLDDKTITSWNAMMCTAFAKAFLTFGNDRYRDIATTSIKFILKTLCDGHKIFRTYKNWVAMIDGFLEDYAFTIEALQFCYLITQEEIYLEKARGFCEHALKEFDNPGNVFMFYTAGHASPLISKTSEISDNVIPSSNSQMALNLFHLGHHFADQGWIDRAGKMLEALAEELKVYGAGYSNWGILALHFTYPFREVAIVGNNVNEFLRHLYNHAVTNAIFAVSAGTSDLPLLKDRFVQGKTRIYVCENQVCQKPVESVKEALEQID
jgi:uncharacterized protein YyaL (SSP411 family)